MQGLRPVLHLRFQVLQAIRCFFQERGFLEVTTPVRLAVPALEDYIEAFPSEGGWLRTSPELHMKRLLAAGYEKIFQIGPCFRREEHGSRHLPEFTMLEWYRLGADWRDILADAMDLLPYVAQTVSGSTRCRFRGRDIELAPPWPEWTVEAAFREHAGVEVDEALAAGDFDRILVESVEPHLGLERPTVLGEYPFTGSGLSRCLPDRPDRTERWELYVAGLELANACSELTEYAEQCRRFGTTEALRRAEGRPIYARDEAFLAALAAGMPPCAGCALGLDRLLMVLTDATSIEEVVPFGGESPDHQPETGTAPTPCREPIRDAGDA